VELRIDGVPINQLSLDQIGATLQQIADELDKRQTDDFSRNSRIATISYEINVSGLKLRAGALA